MGFFSGVKRVVGNVGKAIKKGVVDTGHELGRATQNPWVQGALATGLAATGVGAPAAAAIMAGTKGGGRLIAPGGNLGNAATEGAKGAVMGYGAGKAGELLHGAGVLNKARGAVQAAQSIGGSENDPGGEAPSMEGGDGGGGFLSGARRVLGQGNGYFGTGRDGVSLADLGRGALAVQQGVASSQSAAKADEYYDKAREQGLEQWNAAAPLRTAGLAGLTNRTKPDLSGVYKDTFRAKRRVVS